MKSHHIAAVVLVVLLAGCQIWQDQKVTNNDRRQQNSEAQAISTQNGTSGQELTSAETTRRPEPGSWTLDGFLNDIAPKTSTYRIDPTQDQYLEGPGGTRIFVPAYGLTDYRLNYPEDSVNITLREYYSPAEFARAGLSTTADKRLLQTGGTVNIQAFTEAGEDLRVAPNQTLGLFMPQDSLWADMSWFYGQPRAKGGVNWQERSRNMEYYVRTLTTVTMEANRIINNYDGVELTYTFSDGSGNLHEYLAANPPFDGKELAQFPSQIRDIVFKFRLDEKGKMRNVVMEGSTGRRAIDSKLKSYMEALPAFVRETAADPRDPNRMLALGFDIEVVQEQDTIQPENIDQERYLQPNQKENLDHYQWKPRTANSTWQGDDPLYATFGIGQLGWINCDRFPRTQRLTPLAFRMHGMDDMQLQIYLPEYNGWFRAMAPSQIMSFEAWQNMQKREALPTVTVQNLPVGARALVIALRVTEGNPEFALLEIEKLQVGETITNLDFEAFSPETLEAALKKS